MQILVSSIKIYALSINVGAKETGLAGLHPTLEILIPPKFQPFGGTRNGGALRWLQACRSQAKEMT